MPSRAEVPERLREAWPASWFGVRWHEGRLLTISAPVYRWLRRYQGDYMERCFVRDALLGRSFLRAIPCADGPPRAKPKTAIPGVVVRRCGCGQRRAGQEAASVPIA